MYIPFIITMHHNHSLYLVDERYLPTKKVFFLLLTLHFALPIALRLSLLWLCIHPRTSLCQMYKRINDSLIAFLKDILPSSHLIHLTWKCVPHLEHRPAFEAGFLIFLPWSHAWGNFTQYIYKRPLWCSALSTAVRCTLKGLQWTAQSKVLADASAIEHHLLKRWKRIWSLDNPTEC